MFCTDNYEENNLIFIETYYLTILFKQKIILIHFT